MSADRTDLLGWIESGRPFRPSCASCHNADRSADKSAVTTWADQPPSPRFHEPCPCLARVPWQQLRFRAPVSS